VRNFVTNMQRHERQNFHDIFPCPSSPDPKVAADFHSGALAALASNAGTASSQEESAAPASHLTFARPDPTAIDFLDRLLVVDPDQRMSAREALEHPFMSEWRDPMDPVG
jgi:serine/threonine protein kinase